MRYGIHYYPIDVEALVRVEIPADAIGDPVAYVKDHYAVDIVRAGMNFSATTYHSKLSLREFEGARLRTAQINGCQICQSRRSARDLPSYFDRFGGSLEGSVASNGEVPEESFYVAVDDAWRESTIFSERERLAIDYAERLGTDPIKVAYDEDFWTQMKNAFSDDEIVDLSYCVAAWMGLGRVTHALGFDSVCAV
jgi:alkylhydroperoxidase family enzyme